MVLGAARAWPLGAAFLPATRRGWDPHLPAEPGSHVYLRHGALVFRYMPLVRAATRTEPAGQPRRQLHVAMLTAESAGERPRSAGRPGRMSDLLPILNLMEQRQPPETEAIIR